jgi:hypothetical protein
MKNDLDSRIFAWALVFVIVFLAIAYYGVFG